jgi:serine/threonine protein kinase
MESMLGKTIGNYRISKFIGDGGMGQVWLAEHVLLGRKVAIKSLHLQFARNAGIRARFKQEAATLAHLQHPNIVALHDYIEEGDDAYLVMEYVEGTPLDEFITRQTGPIPTGQLRELFGQILDGFVYAHGKMVVHRDIKPSNFLVNKDGNVKILDFGIAKILTESNQKLTKTGSNMGTVLYMSPEQVRGEALDIRSDIYSLGVTLFQMATGQCPYNSESSEFLVYDQIVNKPLPAASQIYPGVTAEMEALISKATQKLAGDRFQDCAEFKRALMAGEKPQIAAPANAELSKTMVDVQQAPPVVSAPSQPMAPPAAQVTAPSAAPTSTARPTKKGMPMMAIFGVLAGIAVVVSMFVWQPWKNTPVAVSNASKASKASEIPVGLDPEATVFAFYDAIENGDWDLAYKLTTGNPFGNSPKALSNYFECTDCCDLKETSLVSQKDSQAKVEARVQLSGCGKRKTNYVGFDFVLKKVNGDWRIRSK